MVINARRLLRGVYYSYSFRLFFDAWSKSSWNSLFEGTKVPQEQKFQEANVTQKFCPSVDFSLPGMKLQRNEKSDIHVRSVLFSVHCGRKNVCGVCYFPSPVMLFWPATKNAKTATNPHSSSSGLRLTFNILKTQSR